MQTRKTPSKKPADNIAGSPKEKMPAFFCNDIEFLSCPKLINTWLLIINLLWLKDFLRYVAFDTQSDASSHGQPSTEKQKILSSLLVEELRQMGIADAHWMNMGIVYGTVSSTSDKKVPVICFCAHVDTSPDCSGSRETNSS